MAKQKITTQRNKNSIEKEYARNQRNFGKGFLKDVTVDFAYSQFAVYQLTKGNSKQTIAFYDRFYKKYCSFIRNTFNKEPDETQLDIMTMDGMQLAFVASLGDVNQQTINSYLRGYRAFGNFCEEQGYLSGFKCPIKEVAPPIKQVYTYSELKKLLVKPEISYFEGFRNFTIINLLLATGVRTNTILNLRIKDVELEEGYIDFNTTKAHKVVRVGLERKCRAVLMEYISYWRTGGDIEPDDYLFCNVYGEQLTRSGLSTAIARYNREHGVEKTSIHLFRHTFAKNWITSGGDIISLARVLTHSELDMVKHYSNLYAYDVKAEIQEHSALSQLRTNSGETIGTKKKKSLE